MLRDRIQATLTADANVRRQAELDLRQVNMHGSMKRGSHANKAAQAEENPALLDALVHILEVETDNGVRQASQSFLLQSLFAV